MLAVPDNDDGSHFLTSDDNEDELEGNELAACLLRVTTCDHLCGQDLSIFLLNLIVLALILNARKWKALTLAERVKVIDPAAKGKSACAIALSLGVGETQIQGILAKKTSIIQSWKAGTNGKIQYLTVKKSKNGNLNQLVWDWLVKTRSRNFIVTGPILQEKA